MQLKFQTIPKHNAQLLETYIGDIILNSRICTGAGLRVAAGYCGELGLGPGSHASPPAGPAPAAPVAPQPPRTRPPRLRFLHVCNCHEKCINGLQP